MIVATAGHIDHGKTLLVKALTGVDTDRLPEEKKRGLTIDLGFAYRPLPDGSVLGFIDVPGHERFVRNMLAGVTGIDFGLLIVAADDGPMPQTLEHLAILDLLGVERGAVALTKIDRVDAARREAVIAEVAALTAGTALARAPTLPVSAVTGEGIAALRRHLEQEAKRTAAGAARGGFRLAVDRCFTLRGTGLVVTGTVFSGAVRVGDQLLLSPGGLSVRVRGIHAQNREAHMGRAGERCALNLTGPDLNKAAVQRGDWVLAPALHAPTRRIDARLRILRGEKALRDRTPVHLHLGAVDVTGRVAVLEGRAVEPGESALVQFLLDREIGALAGDRYVVRDQSASRTLGGGRIVDPFPPARGRRRPERLEILRTLEQPDAAEVLTALLPQAPAGVALDAFVRARNLAPTELGALWRRVELTRAGEGASQLGVTPLRWQALSAMVSEAVAAGHAAAPDAAGVDERTLRRGLPERVPAVLFAGVVASLVREGRLVRTGGTLRLPGHTGGLSPEEGALWARMRPLLEEGGLRPPRVREIAETLNVDHRAVDAVLRAAVRHRMVYGVADNRFFPKVTLARLAGIAAELAGESAAGTFTAADYRNRTGVGRNVAIELLEFFDRHGFTRRLGDERRVVKTVEQAFDAVEPLTRTGGS